MATSVMGRSFMLLSLLALFGPLPSQLAREGALPVYEAIYEGEIALVAHERLVVSVSQQEYDFFVPHTAIILLNGQEAILDELTAHMLVSVFAERDEQKFVAKIIDARTHRCIAR